MNRRYFLGGGVVALGGCANRTAPVAAVPAPPKPAAVLHLPLVRARVDRMFRITVCVRPFRAAGPRLDVERGGAKTVVTNYGPGGRDRLRRVGVDVGDSGAAGGSESDHLCEGASA